MNQRGPASGPRPTQDRDADARGTSLQLIRPHRSANAGFALHSIPMAIQPERRLPSRAAVAGALEWQGESGPCFGLPSKKPAAERNLVSSEPAQLPGGLSVERLLTEARDPVNTSGGDFRNRSILPRASLGISLGRSSRWCTKVDDLDEFRGGRSAQLHAFYDPALRRSGMGFRGSLVQIPPSRLEETRPGAEGSASGLVRV
ncbi:hypothetical protein BH23GEM9_BH23GEM9_20530 [soil metagenome]